MLVVFLLVWLANVIANDNLVQLDDVAVPAALEDLDLAQARDGQAVGVAGLELEALDGDDAARGEVCGAGDEAVGALFDVVELVVVVDAAAGGKGAAGGGVEAEELCGS